MFAEKLPHHIIADRLLASKVKADKFFDVGVFNVLLHLLQGTLAAEAMTAFELYCAAIACRDGLTFRDNLVGVADGTVRVFFDARFWHCDLLLRLHLSNASLEILGDCLLHDTYVC